MNPPQGFNADEPAYIKKQIDFYFVDPEVLAKTEGGEGFGLYCAVWEFKIRGIVSAIIMISTILVISFIENKSKRRLTKLSDGGSVK